MRQSHQMGCQARTQLRYPYRLQLEGSWQGWCGESCLSNGRGINFGHSLLEMMANLEPFATLETTNNSCVCGVCVCVDVDWDDDVNEKIMIHLKI